MNNKREPFSTTLPPKVITILRKHALIDERITMSEMIERYQNTYLEKIKELKEHNRLKREYEAGEKVKCPFCGKIAEKN